MNTKGRRISRIAAILISLVMLIQLGPAGPWLTEVFAAEEPIGIVSFANGEWKEFTDLGDLVDYVEDLKGRNFTIDMLADWGNERLVINNDSKCTLNMHGHIFNRGLGKYQNNGEVICVRDRSILIVNGGIWEEAETEHMVKYYYIADTNCHWSNVWTKWDTFKGGVIAGGYSDNGGGGIDANGTNIDIYLNDVTIVGCRAAQTWGTDGYGGGIWMHGGAFYGGTITMDNSTITGCYATNDGGGIYQSNHNYFILSLKNGSHIDGNSAGDNGGGVCVDGESLVIKGDNTANTPADKECTISNNKCGDGGGGIYLWNDDVTVRNLTISGNYADDHGGGIYTLEEGIALTNLKIQNNSADEKGGGIYIYNDGNSISGCTITGNYAGSKGGGVYIEDYVDDACYVAGSTVVRDNRSYGGPDNLKIEDDTCEVNFDLGKGSDVHIDYDERGDLGNSMKIGNQKVANCIRYITSDVPGYHITYNSDPDDRKIYIVKDGKDSSKTGEPYVKGTTEKVDPIIEGTNSTGRTITGLSGKEYDVTYGYFRHSDTESQTGGSAADPTVRFYYSDGFFDADPFVYDQHLATASLTLTMAGAYLNAGGTGKDADYTYKHSAGRQFLADIGCEDKDIFVSTLNTERPGVDTMGVTIASKEIETADGSFTLIPVTIRSVGYEGEWGSNVTIGTGETRNGEAQGFSDAAEIVTNELENYLRDYGLEEKARSGEVAFWIVGYSRGGATANLTARRIREKYQDSKLFAYTFATPKGGSNNATLLDDSEYFCIHNVLNAADLVPHVAMGYMGFVRYGVDHYVPGSEAGEVQRIETPLKENASGSFNVPENNTIVTYRDNEPYRTKTGEYNSLRDSRMEAQLKQVDADMVWDDYFRTAYIETNVALLAYGSDFIKENGDYDDYRAEDYMDALMDTLERFAAPSRDDYALNPVRFGDTSYETYQQALRDVMIVVFGTESDTTNKMIDKLDNIYSVILSSSFFDLLGVYDDVLGEWGDLSGSDKKHYSTVLWDLVNDTGMFDVLDEEHKSALRRDWPALLDLICKLLDADYNLELVAHDDTMELIGSLAHNGVRVLFNHYPEVNLAWARAQDDFYDDETTGYELKANVSVGVPEAFTSSPYSPAPQGGSESGEPEIRQVSSDRSAPTRIYESGSVQLDVPGIRGETIFYTLSRLEGDEYTSAKRVYSRGIDMYMQEGAETKTDYEITAYARSLDGTSASASYYVRLFNGKHKVSLDYADIGEGVTDLYYKEGESALIIARPGNGLAFEGWTATDDQGRDVTEAIFGSGDSSDAGKRVAMMTLPVPDEENGFSEFYEINISAKYGEQLNTIQIDGIAAPVSGEDLSTTATLTLRNGMSEEGAITVENVPVTWTYEYQFREPGSPQGVLEILTGGKAYAGGITYRATLNVSVPEGEVGEFAETLSGFVGEGGAPATYSGEDRIGCRKNSLDGSATIVITYPETSYDGYEPYPRFDEIAVINVTPRDTTFGTDINYDRTYYADPDTASNIRITAPNISGSSWDEEFRGWDRDTLPEGFEVPESEPGTLFISEIAKGQYDVTANYTPIVEHIAATIYAPSPGEDPNNAGFVSLEYELNGSNYKIGGRDEGTDNTDVKAVWTPEPLYRDRYYDYDTEYTAILNILPDADGNITVVQSGAGHQEETIKAEFAYTDEVEFEVFVRSVKDGSTVTRTGSFDPASGAHYITFDRTPAKVYTFQYYNAEDIRDIHDVPFMHSGLEEALWELLPKETRVTVTPRDSGISRVPVEWTDLSLTDGPSDGTAASVWTATGKVVLPEYVQVKIDTTDPDHPVDPTDVTINIYVNRELDVSAPAASLASGTFMEAQSTTLESETPGAVIKYTTDGSDPLENGIVYEEHQVIGVGPDTAGAVTQDDGKVVVTLRAIAVKEGLNNSEESIYKYTFTNDVELPSVVTVTYNSSPQIIAEAGEYYTLSVEEGSGAELDEKGNVIATEAGEYKITATIKDGYRWLIPADGWKESTAKDGTEEVPEDKEGPDEGGSDGRSAAGEPTYTTEDQIVTGVVRPANIETLNVKAELEAYSFIYEGQPVEPEVTSVSILGEGIPSGDEEYTDPEVIRELLEGTEYTVSYENNDKVSSEDEPARVLVTGTGNFCGTIVLEFTIVKSLADLEAEADEAARLAEAALEAAEEAGLAAEEAVESAKEPDLSQREALSRAEDAVAAAETYQEKAAEALEAAEALKEAAQALLDAATAENDERLIEKARTLLETAAEYEEEARDHIAKADLLAEEAAALLAEAKRIDIANAEISVEDAVYSGSVLTPQVTVTYDGVALIEGVDYTVSYRENTDIGTGTVVITGTGKYKGTVVTTFSIRGDISDASIGRIPDEVYSGTAFEPAPVVRFNDRILTPGTDYSTSYGNNVNAGTATVTVTGTGDYIGTLRTTFTIRPRPIDEAELSAIEDAEYTGSAIEPAVTVTLDGKVLEEGRDYTVAYSDNTEPGTASVTIKGIGNYTGELSGTFTITKHEEPAPVAEITRIFGENRYKTALKAADEYKEQLGIDEFETVIVACGTDYADALAGSYLSIEKHAPILLVKNTPLEVGLVQDYIRSNLKKGGMIYLLGGTAVVPDAVTNGLDGYEVKRLCGPDRYATNVAILQEAGVTGDEILVASGLDFADSLSASASGRPILLVKNTAQASQNDYVATLEGKKFFIIGGTGVLNTDLENYFSGLGETKRLAGLNRYATSVKVAEEFFPEPLGAVVAYGEDFPDGLCGGSVANELGGPLLLAANGKEAPAAEYASSAGIEGGIVLGGPPLISDANAKKIFSKGADDIIIVK